MPVWDCLTSISAIALTGRAVTLGRRLKQGEGSLPQLDRIPPKTRTTDCGLVHCKHRRSTSLHTAMRDYSATPSNGGTCMPCCQVCVFAFTAFLIIAERTARESLPGTQPRAPPHTREHFSVLSSDCNIILCPSAFKLCYLSLFAVRERVRARVFLAIVYVDVQCAEAACSRTTDARTLQKRETVLAFTLLKYL